MQEWLKGGWVWGRMWVWGRGGNRLGFRGIGEGMGEGMGKGKSGELR